MVLQDQWRALLSILMKMNHEMFPSLKESIWEWTQNFLESAQNQIITNLFKPLLLFLGILFKQISYQPPTTDSPAGRVPCQMLVW